MSDFPDKRFFRTRDPRTAQALAALVDGSLFAGSPEALVTGVSAPEAARSGKLIFAGDPKTLKIALETEASFVLVAQRDEAVLREALKSMPGAAEKGIILCRSPREAFAHIAEALHYSLHDHTPPSSGVASTARIGEGALIADTAIIAENVEIGPHARIGANAVIGQGVCLGEGVVIGANAVVTHTIAGDHCVIRAGAIVGEAGFGFVPTAKGMKHVPQLGRVMLAEEVDIGANSTVDRGGLTDTRIGRATKIDNLVQIAHNVTMGSNCAVASQTGISGSSRIGNNVLIGGQVGVADHVDVGDNTVIKARAALLRDVPGGAEYGGHPARPAKEWMREVAAVSRLAKNKRHKNST